MKVRAPPAPMRDRAYQREANMPQSYMGYRRLRRNFGRIAEVATLPNLIEVQKKSYDAFLQKDGPHDERANAGLQEVFTSGFAIKDCSDPASLLGSRSFVGQLS